MTLPEAISLSPTAGTRRFRRLARIELRDGTLTFTDRRGHSTSVALGPDPDSPKELAAYLPEQGKGRSDIAFIDGGGRTVCIAETGAFDSLDLQDLIAAAGLKQSVRWYPNEPPPLRPDGRVLRDSEWWKWGPAAGPIGLAAATTTNAGFIPAWLGLPLLFVSFIYLLAALFSGAYTGHRVSRDMAAAFGVPEQPPDKHMRHGEE